MRKWTYLLVPLLSLALSAVALQAQLAGAQKAVRGKATQGNPDACKTLGTIGTLVDGAFDGQKDETRILTPMMSDPDDSIWDTLIGCSDATTKASERAEALRSAAMWEWLRAQLFRKMYLEAVGAAGSGAPLSETNPSTTGENPLVRSLQKAQASIDAELEMERRATTEKAQREAVVQARRKAMANPSALATIRAGERLPDEEVPGIAAHNRAVCDQIITVAGLTPSGLALYVPPVGQKFMAKNSKNYPRMCLLEDTEKFVPGVPRYLLVYTYSEDAFSGFQPVTQAHTTPVYGSGTVTNAYGDRWNFTYHGTMTEIDTIEAPYVIQSRSLYLRAYDDKGNVVSQHSVTTSSQTGGDAAWAAGYNGAQLIAMLWNNPSRLIKSVLSDVQKASIHSGAIFDKPKDSR